MKHNQKQKSMKKRFAVVFFIFSFVITHAQSNRIEIEAKKVADNYQVIPVGKEGIIMFYETDERVKGGNKIWVFTKYNTDFKEVWSKEYPLDRSVNYIDYDTDEKNLFLYLGQSQSRGASGQTNNKGEVQIASIDFTSGALKTFTNIIPLDAEIKYFNVVNNHAILSGITLASGMQSCSQALLTCTCIPFFTQYTVFKYKPVVFNFNLGSTTSSAVKNNEFKGNAYVIGSETNQGSGVFDVAYKHKPKYNIAPEIILKKYDSEGNELNKIKLDIEQKKEIVSSRLLNLNTNEQIVLGTYKTSPKQRRYFNPASTKATSSGDDAEGMYFSKIEGGQQTSIKYYPFNQFNQFFTMVSNRFSGSSVNFRFLVHDIIEKNNQYIMVAEAYYPEYETQYYYNPSTKRMETRRVFIGFRYTHALIAGFDHEGNKIWDNSFGIGDILDARRLRERVKVMPLENEVILVYANYNFIESKIISGNRVIEGKKSSKIETGYEKDKVRAAGSENNLEYWYDNFFISYGYQFIKSGEEAKKEGKEKRRRVYYFSKIAYQ